MLLEFDSATGQALVVTPEVGQRKPFYMARRDPIGSLCHLIPVELAVAVPPSGHLQQCRCTKAEQEAGNFPYWRTK